MTSYKELRPCARCLRITRPKSRNADEYPFKTYSRGDACHCQACRLFINGTTKATGRAPLGRPDPGPANAQTVAGLVRYIKARRQRLGAGGGAL